MRSYLIPILFAFLLLIGCSGEGYIKVKNNTPTAILTSVNNLADEVILAGDTSQTYTVSVMKGVINSIPVEASGLWVGNYSATVALTDGETVIHHISTQVADITLTNLSVDSATCTIENYTPLFFVGEDSISDKFSVDGDVAVESIGRYKFFLSEDMPWLPGFTYRYEITPDACEIQLNNIHPNYTIYYVFISLSTSDSWGDDQLGDDILNPQEGYVWKAEGDLQWDMRVEAGDTHIDSPLYVYEFFDTEGCPSDFTWIYEFPTIFTPVAASASSKITGPLNNMMKPGSLNKVSDHVLQPTRIEKIRKVDAGKGSVKALRK
ncbi:MAG: hypothetical protein U9O95_08890 [Candidatus Marinimicrobia bacterium]|nr:hypothetical protein [Candidatus Neomarinimicrobiota bacterium]